MKVKTPLEVMTELAYQGIKLPGPVGNARIDRVVQLADGKPQILIGIESDNPEPRNIPSGATLVFDINIRPSND